MSNNNKEDFNKDYFLYHMAQYIGKNVVVYTENCPPHGFMGVLIKVNDAFISLVTNISNCNIAGDNFNKKIVNDLSNQYHNTITDIPVNKIVAFIHY